MRCLQVWTVAVAILILSQGVSWAEYSSRLTVLAVQQNDSTAGVYEYVEISWDQKSEPEKLQVVWNSPHLQIATRPGVYGGVDLAPEAKESLGAALRYAEQRTPNVRHSGTVTMVGTTFLPARQDGSSAGAAFTVALIAMFKGLQLRGDVCLTGTLEAGGRIGKVESIPQKMRAAWAGGCHLILVPRYQMVDNNWDLSHESLRIGIKVREVETIDEAYPLMVKGRF